MTRSLAESRMIMDVRLKAVIKSFSEEDVLPAIPSHPLLGLLVAFHDFLPKVETFMGDFLSEAEEWTDMRKLVAGKAKPPDCLVQVDRREGRGRRQAREEEQSSQFRKVKLVAVIGDDCIRLF